jgi:hypothetical protein
MLKKYVEEDYTFTYGIASDYSAVEITSILDKLKLAMNKMNATITADIIKINIDMYVKDILSNRYHILSVYKESELIAAIVYNIGSSMTYNGPIPCFISSTIWVSDDASAQDIFMSLKDFLCSINIYCVKITDARKGFTDIFDKTALKEGTTINELNTSDVMVYFDKDDKNKVNFIVRR